jgi:hypothetical protein
LAPVDGFEAIAAVVVDVALGAYRFGSATLGGLKPRSDLDVLVATREPIRHRDALAALDLGRPIELTAAMRDGIAELDLEGDTTNALLTLARIRCTLETGTIHSKEAAASWVLEREPDPALAHAREVYLGANERWDEHDVPADVAARMVNAVPVAPPRSTCRPSRRRRT